MDSLVASASQMIHAVPSLIFNEITEGGKFVYHKFHQAVSSDWQTGSDITFHDEDNGTDVHGTVVENEAPLKLSYLFPITDCEGGSDKNTTVTFLLEPVNMKTRVTVSQGDFSVFTNGDVLLNDAVRHWQEFLHRVKNHVEAELRSFP